VTLHTQNHGDTHSEEDVPKKNERNPIFNIGPLIWSSEMKERKEVCDKHNSPNWRKGDFFYHEIIWSHKWKITAIEKCWWKHYVKGNKGYQREQKQSRKRTWILLAESLWECVIEIKIERERKMIKKQHPPATLSLTQGIYNFKAIIGVMMA